MATHQIAGEETGGKYPSPPGASMAQETIVEKASRTRRKHIPTDDSYDPLRVWISGKEITANDRDDMSDILIQHSKKKKTAKSSVTASEQREEANEGMRRKLKSVAESDDRNNLNPDYVRSSGSQELTKSFFGKLVQRKDGHEMSKNSSFEAKGAPEISDLSEFTEILSGSLLSGSNQEADLALASPSTVGSSAAGTCSKYSQFLQNANIKARERNTRVPGIEVALDKYYGPLCGEVRAAHVCPRVAPRRGTQAKYRWRGSEAPSSRGNSTENVHDVFVNMYGPFWQQLETLVSFPFRTCSDAVATPTQQQPLSHDVDYISGELSRRLKKEDKAASADAAGEATRVVPHFDVDDVIIEEDDVVSEADRLVGDGAEEGGGSRTPAPLEAAAEDAIPIKKTRSFANTIQMKKTRSNIKEAIQMKKSSSTAKDAIQMKKARSTASKSQGEVSPLQTDTILTPKGSGKRKKWLVPLEIDESSREDETKERVPAKSTGPTKEATSRGKNSEKPQTSDKKMTVSRNDKGSIMSSIKTSELVNATNKRKSKLSLWKKIKKMGGVPRKSPKETRQDSFSEEDSSDASEEDSNVTSSTMTTDLRSLRSFDSLAAVEAPVSDQFLDFIEDGVFRPLLSLTKSFAKDDNSVDDSDSL